MSRKRATVVNMGDGTVGIFCDYNDKDRAKALPGSRWDAANKCWRVSSFLADEARRLVDELNGETRQPTGHTAPQPNELVDVLRKLFSLLPQNLRQATYRALAKALHPDSGGDEASAKALTAAWASIK